MTNLIEAALKWVAIVFSFFLGIFLWGKNKVRHGRTREQLKQTRFGDKAQEAQHETLENHRGRDLVNDIHWLQKYKNNRK